MALYRQGWGYARLRTERGLMQARVEKALSDAVSRGEITLRTREPYFTRGKMIKERVLELHKQGLTPKRIERDMDGDTTLASIYQILHEARKKGEIAVSEYGGVGRRARPKILVQLPPDTRLLLDAEAEDLGRTPAEVAAKILHRVLNDQELIEAALAA